jgi:pyruvyl transferase EpsO
MDHVGLVGALAAELERTLRPLLAGARRVALLDYPAYPNVGDSAIWLGQLALLSALGVRPAYRADLRGFRPERLRARVGDGPILLGGGGNLGDLWEQHQRFREAVIREFPENPIVQLPQSIWFRDPAALARARAAFDAHPRLMLLVRDRRSLALARDAFRTPSALCPDPAFCLGPLARPASHRHESVWLLRTDLESAGGAAPPGVPEDARFDWRREAPLWLAGLQARLSAAAARGGPAAAAWARAAEATYAPLARARLARGLARLAAGRRVVTDRLHGHVLCLLLGIPHLLIDDRLGKLRAFHETWTASSELVTFCGGVAEAERALAGAGPEVNP